MIIKTLGIDLETRSGTDIGKSGVYRYAEDPDFAILLFGISINEGPVRVYALAEGEELPEEILEALVSNEVIKFAHNTNFERICLSEWLRRKNPDLLERGMTSPPLTRSPSIERGGYLNPISWRCTMVWAAYCGLPFSLKQVGEALGLEEQKMSEGRSLIRYFCVPPFHSPSDSPEKWETFKAYNKRDVEVEQKIRKRLEKHPVPDFIWAQYAKDQAINDTGIRIDRELVESAIQIDQSSHEHLMNRLKELTGLENPNSPAQMKEYLTKKGLPMESIGKKEVQAALADAPEELKEVLSLRLKSAKSSVKKYEAMKNAVCQDGRCRGMFQFYGASRSGRWAGRLIQLQNLPQNKMSDLDEARTLVKDGDEEMLELLYPSVPQVLSELIRTAFIPEEGRKFVVADYSAIEARVLAHLAGESWRAEVFKSGGDIYCASASQMFHVPVEKHGVNGHLRQKGKIAELALGYGGSVGALKAMGALELGLTEQELQPLVSMWREANPNIVQFWWEIDRAAKEAIRTHMKQQVGDLEFSYDRGILFLRLPSGRQLAYVKPELRESLYGGECITYLGLTAQNRYERIESYGPKLVENITQAVSRDILAEAMQRLKQYRIVGHVHDEVIIEAEKTVSVRDICDEITKPIPWAKELCLKADGYECPYYKKD